MDQKSSLSPLQIQYLKIGPKVGRSAAASRTLQSSLSRFEVEGAEDATLSNIPKYSFGNFESTVNNFGVLLHRNFVGTTTRHQAQKFGSLVFSIDQAMEGEKDKPSGDARKGGLKKTFSDQRNALKGIYDYNGHKFLVTLKSFSIESLQTNRVVQILPIPFLKLITTHVSSAKLVKAIDNALRAEGSNMSVIDFEKMEGKVSQWQNAEERYNEGPHLLERNGQQFTINLPCLELYHSESDYRISLGVDNRDIIEMIQSDMDNIASLVRKYIDFTEFENHLATARPE